MQGSRITTFESLARQQRRQVLLRAYQTGLVVVAASLLILVAMASKPQGYTALVTVRGEGMGGSHTALDTWLRSPEVLQTAYRNLKERSSSGMLRSELPHEDMAAFRQRVQLTPLSQSEEAPSLSIEFTAQNATLALQGAEELAYLVELDYEVFQHAKRISQFDHQLKDLSGKLSQLQLARQECNQLVERVRYNQIARAMQTAQARSNAPQTTENNINPRWTQTREKLDQLIVSRAQLLSKLLPNHPQVEQMDLQIAFLQQQIRTIPKTRLRQGTEEANEENRRTFEDSDDRAAQSPFTTPLSLHRTSHTSSPAIQTVAGEENLIANDPVDVDLSTAIANLARLGQQERQTQLEIDTLRREAVSQITQCVWSSSAPKIMRQQGAKPISLRDILLATTGGLIFGGAFLASTFWSRDGKLLWSLSQTQAALKLPVIAMLNPQGETSAPKQDLPVVPKTLLFGAGVVLVLLMLALLGTAFMDAGVYFRFGQAPLETLVQAASCWLPAF